MRIGAIVLARLDSRRLPGKALLDLNGKPLIQYAFDACAATVGVDATILATTDRSDDDRLAHYAGQQGVACYRGALDDVAGRFLAAMDCFELDAALRFNGDSPLNRPRLLSEAIASFRCGDWDVVTNVPGRKFPFGISAEVVSRTVMTAACAAMSDPAEREHVTKIFYDRPSFARIFRLEGPPDGAGLNLAVDDAMDLKRAEWILRQLRAPLLTVSLASLVDLARAYERIEPGADAAHREP